MSSDDPSDLTDFIEVYPHPAAILRLCDQSRPPLTATTPKPQHKHALVTEHVNAPWTRALGGGKLDMAANQALRAWLEDEDRTETLPLPHRGTCLHLTKTALRSGRYVVTSITVPSHSLPPQCPCQTTALETPPLEDVVELDAKSSLTTVRPAKILRGLSFPLPHTISPECEALFMATDWASTSLGPVETWPTAALTALRGMFSAPRIYSIYLGDELVGIYNDAYARSSYHHPRLFGKPSRLLGPQLWTGHAQRSEIALTGKTVSQKHALLEYKPDERGRLIEMYFDWAYYPIYDRDQDRHVGLMCPAEDTTADVLTERRFKTTRNLIQSIGPARTTSDFFQRVARSLESNPADVPFVLCYRVTAQDPNCSRSNVELVLEAAVGVPANHPGAPSRVDVDIMLTALPPDRSGAAQTFVTSHEREQWPFDLALSTGLCVAVDDCSSIVKGFDLRKWDELPDRAVLLPLLTNSDERRDEHDSGSTLAGVLVVGVNVRRPLDGEYTEWFRTLRGLIGSSLGAVRALEEETTRRLERERLVRARTNLVQGAAHGFRPPLTLIAGPLDEVLQTALTPMQKRRLRVAQRNVWRLQQLVDLLLDFSRIECGHMQPRFVAGDLGPFVSELVNMFRPAAMSRNISLGWDIEHTTEPVCFDPPLLETVVSNLVAQALQLTAVGTVTVRLRYETRDNERWAVISVEDTGAGVPESFARVLSEGIYTLDLADTKAELSLALAQEIVRLHDGELTVEGVSGSDEMRFSLPGDTEVIHSTAMRGSTFTASFPAHHETYITKQSSDPIVLGGYGARAAKGALESISLEDDDTTTSNVCSSGVTGKSSGGWADTLLFEPSDTLLIVDSNSEICSYVRALFAPFCRVIEASDGQEALALATVPDKKLRPHLILSDLFLVKMNGHELLAALRASDLTSSIPFVFLSTCTNEESPATAIVAGADDFIMKPFRPRELIARVHLHMQMGKRRAKLERKYLARARELAVTSDYCPVAIVRCDLEGNVSYANDAFLAPSGITREEIAMSKDSWISHIHPADRDKCMLAWRQVRKGVHTHIPCKWRWENGRVMQGIFTRLDLVAPELKGVLACSTDITEAEERLHEAERRRIEAEESKRQQELLVDLTSHEIRTPVSAILQCSSLVRENLCGLRNELQRAGEQGFTPSMALLQEIDQDIEALESIYQCGLIQERIAGDVLSLARIQLNMLNVHEVEVDVRLEAQKIISIFASESLMNGVKLELLFGDSLDRMGVRGIKTDPVRLGQVVMNLVTNAMRFTMAAETKRITVRFEAAWEPPKGYVAVKRNEGQAAASPPDGDVLASPSTVPVTTDPFQFPDSPSATAAPPADSEVAEDTPAYLFVSVKDSGPGMTPSEQAMLFQRFQQGNKVIHTRYGGSGLGLFICKKITQLLGGDIRVESQEGEGTTFHFFIATRTTAPDWSATPSVPGTRQGSQSEPTMPDMQNATPPADPVSPVSSTVSAFSSSAETAGVVSPPLTPMCLSDAFAASQYQLGQPPLQVLIVEDNLINQTVLKRQLSRAGFQCDVASNGEEALASIDTAPVGGYDIVLMDVEMPVMDGITAVQTLRQREQSETEEGARHNLVIALTGNARPGQISTARAAGFDNVMIKPYKLPDLVTTMRTAVAQHRSGGGQSWPGKSA